MKIYAKKIQIAKNCQRINQLYYIVNNKNGFLSFKTDFIFYHNFLKLLLTYVYMTFFLLLSIEHIAQYDH